MIKKYRPDDYICGCEGVDTQTFLNAVRDRLADSAA